MYRLVKSHSDFGSFPWHIMGAVGVSSGWLFWQNVGGAGQQWLVPHHLLKSASIREANYTGRVTDSGPYLLYICSEKNKSKKMTMINTFREHLQNFKTFREQPQMAILEKLWNCWHFWQWTAFAILAMFTLGMLVRESDELKTSASWIELKLSTRVWWLKTSSIKEIYQV